MPEEALRARFRLVIDGNRWALKEKAADMAKVWTVRVGPGKDPKQVDFRFQFGDNKGKTSLGIYRLTGDTLRVCLADPGEGRPTRFEGKGQRTLNRFQRAKSKH